MHRLVNSPKIGNKKAVEWLKENAEITAFYDRGDIVRFLPLFYKKFYDNRSYGKTTPFWKAHKNFPIFWKKFFEKEKK